MWLNGKILVLFRLSALSMPVRWNVAAMMDLSPLPVRDVKRAAALCGKAMAFNSAGLVQMVACPALHFLRTDVNVYFAQPAPA